MRHCSPYLCCAAAALIPHAPSWGAELAGHWHCRSDSVYEWAVTPDGRSAAKQELVTASFQVELMGCSKFSSMVSKLYGPELQITKNIIASCTSRDEDFRYENIVNISSSQLQSPINFPLPFIWPDEEIVDINKHNDDMLKWTPFAGPRGLGLKV